MKTILLFSVLLACLAFGSAVWAQQSANYRLKAYDLNAGGTPKDGAALTSTNYACIVSSIGDGLAATGMTSASYKANAGFPATTVPPPSGCALTCMALASPSSGPSPLAVNFTAAATPSNCTESLAFAWAFGDGQTSTQQSPSHTYGSAGNYNWTMTTGIQGVSCSQNGMVSVTSTGTKPGDCDGDGQVSIGEVQKAINMFLGIAQAGARVPPTCGVDCNGDGQVSIGEVQKVINAFLGMPSSC